MLCKQADSTTLKYLVFECMDFMQNMVLRDFKNCNLSKLHLDKSKLQLDKCARFVANLIFVANTCFLGFFVQTFTPDI